MDPATHRVGFIRLQGLVQGGQPVRFDLDVIIDETKVPAVRFLDTAIAREVESLLWLESVA